MTDEEKRKTLSSSLSMISKEDFHSLQLGNLGTLKLSPDFKYEEDLFEILVALDNNDTNYYFKGDTFCRKKNIKDNKNKGPSKENDKVEILSPAWVESQLINLAEKAKNKREQLQNINDILNDPLHEAVAKHRLIDGEIEVNTIQMVKEPVKKSCKLCKNNFKQKKIEAYQVVTIDDYYSLEENTHYVCKNCIEDNRIEVKSK